MIRVVTLSSRLLQVTNESWKFKKSLFRNWQLIPNLFIAHLPILVRCKTEGEVGAVCALQVTAQLAIRCMHNCQVAVRDGTVTLKGSDRKGDGQIFSKNLRASLFHDNLSSIEWAYIRPDPSRWTVVPLRTCCREGCMSIRSDHPRKGNSNCARDLRRTDF
jgi:hypothetical protein